MLSLVTLNTEGASAHHGVDCGFSAAVLPAKRDEIDRAGDRPLHIVVEKWRNGLRVARLTRVVEIPHALA